MPSGCHSLRDCYDWHYAKLFAAELAATGKYDAEAALCAGLTAPHLSQHARWLLLMCGLRNLPGVAFLKESAVASTVYFSACAYSEQILHINIQTADDVWFTSAQACNPPPGVLPERSWIVAGQEPNGPQYVESHL